MSIASIRLHSLVSFCIAAYVLIVFGFAGVPVVSSLGILLVAILMFFCAFDFKSIYKPKWIYFFIFYILYFSIPFFILDNFVFEKLGKFIVSSVGAVIIGLYIENGVFKFKYIIYISIVAFFLNLFVISLGYNTGPMTGVGRYSGLTGNPNVLALSAILPIFFIYLFHCEFSLKFKLFTFCIAILAVYLTGTRKALVLLILLACMFFGEVLKKYLIRGILLLCSFIAFLGFLILKSGSAVLENVPVLRRVMRIFESSDESFDGRLELALQGWELFWESPILGHGLAQFEILSGTNVYAHNNYVEVAVAGGALGLFLYYFFYVMIFCNSLKIKHNIYYFIFVFALLVNDFFIVSIYSRSQFLILILLLVASERFFLESKKR